MFKTCKKPPMSIISASGSICTFNALQSGLPLKSCVSQISGYQEGTGTPSPSNVRPLHAFSSATLTDNGNTHLFTFGQSIYQGSIDWERGVVVGNMAMIDLGTLTWIKETGGMFRVRQKQMKAQGTLDCEKYNGVSVYDLAVLRDGDISVTNTQAVPLLRILDTDCENMTETEFKEYVNGTMLAYELATPIEIQLSGIQIATIRGSNTIFADTGDVDLTYKDLDLAKRGNFREVFKLPS